MALIILLAIYNTVIVATLPTPLGQMITSKKYAATAVPYIDKNNKATAASYFLPTNTDIESILKIASLDGQREIWADAVANSSINALNAFNIAGQLATTYWSGELYEAWYNEIYSSGIGKSSTMDYSITSCVNKSGENYVDPEQDRNESKPLIKDGVIINDDNAEVWSNVGKVDSPTSWFDLSNVSREDTYNVVRANSYPLITPESSIIDQIQLLVEKLMLLYTGYNVMSGSTSSTYARGNSKYYHDVSKTESTDTYAAEAFYDGKQVSSRKKQLNWQSLEPNEYEVDLFNAILYSILFTYDYFDSVSAATTQAAKEKIIFDDDVNTNKWFITMNNVGPCQAYPAVNKVLYNDFFSKPAVKSKLGLETDKDVGMEIARFKYYASVKLTGQAKNVINQDYESGTDNYIIKNGIDYFDNNEQYIVPWDAYFKCVYYPQFNSLNVTNMG
ncbi:MAG: hypothetical protein HUJ52_03735, partial [Malacoplasma sp.]|nr:hypothetical protein [Malacoplasma sp.]